MTFAVLPVKDPRNAKQRLAGLLAPPEREALARSMYKHVIQTLRAARGIDRIAVATSDPATARHAQALGAIVFEEQEQLGHSRSADAAARRARQLGASTVLLLPVDVPLVTAAEIEEVLTAAPRPGMLIVPSRDGTGTNALVSTPPDAIETCFGPGSFDLHLRQGEQRGLTVQVLRPPGLVFDVDTPEDFAELTRHARPDHPC